MNRIQGICTDVHEGIVIRHDSEHKGFVSIRVHETEKDECYLETDALETTFYAKNVVLDISSIRIKGWNKWMPQYVIINPNGSIDYQPYSHWMYYASGCLIAILYYWTNG